MTDDLRCSVRAAILLCLLALAASAAPAASVARRTANEALGTDTHWFLWPLVEKSAGPDGRIAAVHPFWSRHRAPESADDSTHVLWPFLVRRHRPDTWNGTDRRSLSIVPLWHSSTNERGDLGRSTTRYLIPFYWQGSQTRPNEPKGRYLVLFPFFWHAENARMAVPLFPPRPQNFSAIFPLGGTFEGYWNADRVRFFLWPLLVESTKRKPDETVKLYSFPWPFLGLYSAERTSGFRVWPLFSRVSKPGEFTRAYWLWPLGHYRSETAADAKRSPKELFLFLPFYGRARDPKLSYDLVFPFYGELRQKGRTTRGYALALYNSDDNLRKGVRNHRLLWFIVRWTSRIPVQVQPAVPPTPEEVASAPGPMEGGGVFPLYVRQSNGRSLREYVLWPFWTRRVDDYDDRVHARRFLLPFHGRTEVRFKEDDSRRRGWFLWPLKRAVERRDGSTFSSVPHLFPYTEADPVDRNWAPLWMAWTRHANPSTGEARVRLFGNLTAYDRTADGTVRREVNLGVYSWKNETAPDGGRTGRVKVLFGLVRWDWNKPARN